MGYGNWKSVILPQKMWLHDAIETTTAEYIDVSIPGRTAALDSENIIKYKSFKIENKQRN